MVNVKPVHLGETVRMSFSRIDEVLEMPNLIEVQKDSYQWFLDEGLKEVFKDVSGITDYTGNLVLDFVDYKLDVDKPNYTVEECKERDTTYAAALRVTARLLNKESGEIKESEVFMGDFPLMTDSGTFVINGAERVIVSQLRLRRYSWQRIIRAFVICSVICCCYLFLLSAHESSSFFSLGGSLRYTLSNLISFRQPCSAPT